MILKYIQWQVRPSTGAIAHDAVLLARVDSAVEPHIGGWPAPPAAAIVEGIVHLLVGGADRSIPPALRAAPDAAPGYARTQSKRWSRILLA